MAGILIYNKLVKIFHVKEAIPYRGYILEEGANRSHTNGNYMGNYFSKKKRWYQRRWYTKDNKIKETATVGAMSKSDQQMTNDGLNKK